MRIVIAGAGRVGLALAFDMLEAGHRVLLIDKSPEVFANQRLAGAEFLRADACEISSLERARVTEADVVVATAGDDKVNIVVSLLAKFEYQVPRVIARVNHPRNRWLFNSDWGVDVAVSTAELLAALVEEAVTVGELVRLLTFRQGQAHLMEIRLPEDARVLGQSASAIPATLPPQSALVAVLRGEDVLPPTSAAYLQADDQLMFLCGNDPDLEQRLHRLLLVEA